MAESSLREIYLGYIACLNRQDWSTLEHFLVDDLRYNDKRIDISGYRTMLKRHCDEIPDLYFDLHTLIAEPPLVASRLVFNCTPNDTFLGLPVRRRRILFSENAIYRFRDEKIEQIWSVIDKAAIEAQL
jgi:predicted ester cyclase